MFKINNKDTKKTPRNHSSTFIVNFEYISHLAIGFLLLTYNKLIQ